MVCVFLGGIQVYFVGAKIFIRHLNMHSFGGDSHFTSHKGLAEGALKPKSVDFLALP